MQRLSKNEEDYLKAVYYFEHTCTDSGKAVSIHLIAEKLKVASPSATEMVKRLAKKELVDYRSYYGVTLSKQGRAQARFIIKSHRVWESFLVEMLGYSVEQVHEEAENLEHASSPRLIEYLYALLNYPKNDPHGAPIPQELFWTEDAKELSLSEAIPGELYHIVSIEDEAKRFFEKIGMDCPNRLLVVECLKDGTMIAKENSGQVLVLPAFIQGKISLMQQSGRVTNIADNRGDH
ncbi:MAG: metal-dependent transcriptional regulator [Streptococcaceae bacterium]|nr:metal-dependent transcriptional regulator [Streptococcaceae bacterium]